MLASLTFNLRQLHNKFACDNVDQLPLCSGPILSGTFLHTIKMQITVPQLIFHIVKFQFKLELVADSLNPLCLVRWPHLLGPVVEFLLDVIDGCL